MRISPVLVALLLATGCSRGGRGGAADRAARPISPPLQAPSSSAASPPAAPGGVGQTAVPAEKNPPGDIPDNVAYVAYRNALGRYSFSHPEGWSETTRGSAVSYTDKLNGVLVLPGPGTTAPTVGSAKRLDVFGLQRGQAAFELRDVAAVIVPAGQGVRIIYRRNSVPDVVTGRQYRDEVERYELVSAGREIIVEMYGPVGSDNVDAYQTMISSLRLG